MILSPLRNVPVFGELAYRWYLRARYADGTSCSIQNGPLKGMKFRKWMRSYIDGYVEGEYEPLVTGAIAQHCKPGMTFYDIGANAGYMTLVGSVCVGPAGKVFSFEPIRNTARELTSQLRANRIGNVRVVRAAVCDRDGTVALSAAVKADMVSMVRDWGGKKTSVPSITIDTAAARFGAPDVIKMDIEEAELLALQGARGTLSRHRPVMLIELHTAKLAQACLALLDEAGYVHEGAGGGPVDRESWTRFVVSRPSERPRPSIHTNVGTGMRSTGAL